MAKILEPDYVADLFRLNLIQLQDKYKKKCDPSKPRIKNLESLKQLRRKYIKDDMEQSPEKRLTGTWESLIKNAEGEAEIHTLHKYAYEMDPTQYPQAVPAIITPTKRSAPKRDYKSIFVFSDTQIDYRRIGDELIPIHDERAMRVARLICADIQPEVIVNCGDTMDMTAYSRFKPDSDHFHATIGPSFQRTHDMYAEYRSDNPKAKIVEVDSNHNVRPRNWMLQNMPQMYNVKQAGAEEEDYPVMSYAFLANLKHVGVEWISGYGSAEYQYAPDLIFRHGTVAVSNGSTAAKVSKLEPEVNVVQGHAHRTETHYRTNRAGKYLASVVVGALCKTTGEVPSYHSAVNDRNQPVHHQEDWSQSVLVINDYGEGNYEFRNVLIHDGVAFYDGKRYEA